MDHPLKSLREASGCSQVEICRRTGISPTRLSLAEKFLIELTAKEEEPIRETIVELTNVHSLRTSRESSSSTAGPRSALDPTGAWAQSNRYLARDVDGPRLR
jgi:transcriptional regulator with XRE-family HTH domain